MNLSKLLATSCIMKKGEKYSLANTDISSIIPKIPTLPNSIDEDGSLFIRMLKEHFMRISIVVENTNKKLKAAEDKIVELEARVQALEDAP